MHAPLVLLFLLSLAQAPVSSRTADDDLAIVRSHYASAAYEEALAHLTTLESEAVTAELEQYRALCLLALGRAEDGEQAFERLVRIAPLYQVPEAEMSPRIYAVFRDVRRRVLPLVVRALYAQGKTSYDEKRYDDAAFQLGNVNRLLDDPDLGDDASALADLRQLTDGFLRLAEAELALAARAAALEAAAAAAPPPAPEPAAPPPSPAPANDEVTVTKIVVYSRADAEVTAPVELERFMPPWTPPATMARFLEYRGELEVVISEAGRVEQARMLQPTSPSYDASLIGATEQWRFEPARLHGEPVKYVLTFQVVLSPRQ